MKLFLLKAFSLIVIVSAVLCACSTGKVLAQSYTVSTANDSGPGSLRSAILNSNQTGGSNSITFSIGSGHVAIALSSPLPAVTTPTSLDASTQPGFSGVPLIELRGANAGANSIGLYITNSGAGSTIRGFIINGFSGQGIFIDTSNVTVKGNYIGTDYTGDTAIPNNGGGIGIFSGISSASANNNTIGGNSAADRNLISGNKQNGIVINAQNGGNTLNNTVSGNYIGTTADGSVSLANSADGILINDAGAGTATGNVIGGSTNVTLGGSCTGSCNLVSGNGYNGIGIWHSGASNNRVLGNFVGVTASGSWVIRNANIGVELNESPNNIVGGTDNVSRNILSGNAGAGVFITGEQSVSNQVLGNYIGVDTTGNYSLNNLTGGVGIGYSPGIQPAHGNYIGSSVNKTAGTCNGGCNIISGNVGDGILLSSTYGNTISANHIGVNVNDTNLVGNSADGIGFLDSPNNIVGGNNTTDGNVINGNSSNGITVAHSGSTGNRIVNNTISSNAGNGVLVANTISTAILQNGMAGNGKIAIDLGQDGITHNDLGDGDSGANDLQNFPDIYAARQTAAGRFISGNMNSNPSTSYELDFFESRQCNAGRPNNYGQGENFIGSTTVTTDIYGNSVFTFSPSVSLLGNTYITATATRMINGIPAETSEYSLCRLVNTTRPALTNGATWYLKDDLTSTTYDNSFGYGFPSKLLMCAWDPNQKGVKLPALYNQGSWYMRASYTTGVADLQLQYGSSANEGLCGDWNGDAVDSVGVYTPADTSGNATFNLKDNNTSNGTTDYSFQLTGVPSCGDVVVGDWNGDGKDGVGIYCQNSGTWYLKNGLSSGPADYVFSYGGPGWLPVVGDWNGDGSTDVGVYNASQGIWNMRDSLSSGPPSGAFTFYLSNATPMTW